MNIEAIMEEYEIEIDDVRWYLSVREAERLVSYTDNTVELARLIWSGRLEASLYHMAERYVDELQDRVDRSFADEAEVHKIMGTILQEREKRRR